MNETKNTSQTPPANNQNPNASDRLVPVQAPPTRSFLVGWARARGVSSGSR